MAGVALWEGSLFGVAGGHLQCVLEDQRFGIENLQEWYRRIIYVVRSIAVDRFVSAARLALNIPCQTMGAVRPARGDRKSGANGCQGASWSEELDGKDLHGALGGERNLEPRGSPFFGHRLPILLRRLQWDLLISKCSPCTAVHYQTASLS